ncbi:MAG: crossover junction endodeoxyribonuclease ruvC [Chloroflexota bacterium]|jgi:crossover junction endodeoxyribonuclease RuvC|nr:MAG: crossover junction endodeoxyribonuclease RuvC [Chloroflexota bacterium]
MSLRVLGLDPGTATFGWGVVESGGERLVHRAHGVILTEPSLALGDRLAVIRDALVAIIREQRPDRIAIERIFSQGNVQSAVGIGAARGVTLLVAADLALPLIEATPSEMKRAVAGDGRASKAAVTLAVTRLLGLSAAPTPNDAADALGLAIWGGGAARLERAAGSSRADRSSAQGIAAESGFDRAVRAALRAERR